MSAIEIVANKRSRKKRHMPDQVPLWYLYSDDDPNGYHIHIDKFSLRDVQDVLQHKREMP